MAYTDIKGKFWLNVIWTKQIILRFRIKQKFVTSQTENKRDVLEYH